MGFVPRATSIKKPRKEMAQDYVRMACAEAKKLVQPMGNTAVACEATVLVVGGGITGMTAALEASKTGYKVVLVEKAGELGGWAGKLWKRVAYKEPFADPADTGVAAMIAAIEADKKIKVYLNATIAKTDGAPGRFNIDIATESGSVSQEHVGSIVQASGFTLYDMTKLPELGGGTSPNVVDQAGLEALAKAANGGAIKRADGAEVKSVVFVQCAGQRDDSGKHLSYCSGTCCNTSIKQAMYFKDQNPDVDTIVIFDDLRTPGNGEDFYRSAQKKA